MSNKILLDIFFDGIAPDYSLPRTEKSSWIEPAADKLLKAWPGDPIMNGENIFMRILFYTPDFSDDFDGSPSTVFEILHYIGVLSPRIFPDDLAGYVVGHIRSNNPRTRLTLQKIDDTENDIL